MKRILPLIIFALTALSSMAQDGFNVNPNPVDTTFDATTPDPVGKALVCNTGQDSIDLYWAVMDDMVPFQWESYVCDKNLCYGSDTRECPPTLPMRLAPGECGNLDLHIVPMGNIECGKFKMTVWESGDEDNKIEVSYRYNCLSNSDDIAKIENISVFPNPALDYFEMESEIPSTYLTINNLLGKEMAHFNMSQGNRYPIHSFPQGMYVVNVFSPEGDLLKSVRLRKI